MRITHVSDCYLPMLGGIEAQVSRLAAQQVAAGHEVEVITTTPAAPGGHGVSTAVENGVTVHRIAARIPFGAPIHPRSTTHVMRRLAEAVQAGAAPDVVHLHFGVLAPTVQAALRPITRLGLPTMVTVHSVWGGTERAFGALDRVVRWGSLPVLWSAVSELTAAPLRRVVGDRGGVVVVPNGLDLDAWRVPRTERAGRAEGAAVHVVSAARFAPRKRMLHLLDAVSDAVSDVGARHGSSALFVTLVGEGLELSRARRIVAERGLQDVVALPGRLTPTELKRLYARADVFVAPAVQEAFGIAALEAQAAGLTVVTRARSGVAERLTDGVDGLVATSDAGIADALVRLATEDGLLDRLLAAASGPAAASDWSHVLAATEKAYERAAALVAPRQSP
ncbi:glycosyltransferase family 4 protein [Antribacter sp. KLBMP9083]|uniref:Glycosyltransferase family 4 protein n=1 Tax=Antribacter soli TaxID=2910976 RepID=A0AA41QFU5_9MICO|nr:glycosyltransferase family 4 protein [Antribacter soli]MCF4122688.1 glycosyltransferase family 4 protein [Antribacter soli]